MKKSIVIMLMLFMAITVSGSVIIHDNTNRADSLYSKVLLFACRELNIDSITIIVSENIWDKALLLSENGKACVHQLSKVLFVINIAITYKAEEQLALIHEAIHIKQMISGNLRVFPMAAWFNGKLYTRANSTYEERPFEKEAYDKASDLYLKYRHLLKSR